MTLASDGEALLGAWFECQRHFGSVLSGNEEERALPIFEDAHCWLDAYFAGKVPAWTPKLQFKGTAFREAVWKALLEIPYGETLSYGELAMRVAGGRNFARAVGMAVGWNPLSVIVPCHRVLGAGGSLTGYAGGVERKRWLLELEQSVSSKLTPN